MNNDQNKGVTGVAKTGTGILGNTVSGLSNTVGGAVGMSFFSSLALDNIGEVYEGNGGQACAPNSYGTPFSL